MSVQHESLEMKQSERKHDAPELEYKTASQDSLSMFFAAIGGAVLGVLATLLILALINGGTLSFTNPERMAVLEANLNRVNENVGAVSQNVDTVSQGVSTIRADLDSTQTEVGQLAATVGEQGSGIGRLQTDMQALEHTGEQFDRLVLGLRTALDSMEPAAPTAAAPAAREPVIMTSAAVPPADVAVLLFVDANGNGIQDGDETNVIGIGVLVKDDKGATVDFYTATDAGILIEGLQAGNYTIRIDDADGHILVSEPEAKVTIPADATEGQIVYFSLAGK